MTKEIHALRAAVQTILEHPLAFPWSVQGFGMMRTYFGRDKKYRLNVWDRGLGVRNVSVIHDHPWDFTSWIMAGKFCNLRFQEHPHGMPYSWMVIKTGEGGGPDGERGEVRLINKQPEQYTSGDSYWQKANEIHYSSYEDGTVTINERIKRGDGEHARVFWPSGQEWVDAAPRDAFPIEIETTAALALTKFA